MDGPIVITGGGTGGHVFAMQAIAEQLTLGGVAPSAIRFVGSRRGQEAALLAGSGIELILLPGRGLRRSLAPGAVWRNAGAVCGLVVATIEAMYRVRRWRPAVVVSVGGYASFATAFAAVVWRRPLVLIELDAQFSTAHRLLGPFAQRRCTAFPSTDRHSLFTGSPLREAIVAIDRTGDSRRRLRLAQSPPIEPVRQVVVVMTGSLGATRVNRAVTELARQWADRTDRTLWHVTGRRDFDRVVADRPVSAGLDYRIEAFGDMTVLWAMADVALCRAGATTIGELTALAIPAVLVPLAGAPRDHQTKNAQALELVGGARLLRDQDCDGSTLAQVLDDVLVPQRLQAMSAASATLGRRDAAAAIAQVVFQIGGLT